MGVEKLLGDIEFPPHYPSDQHVGLNELAHSYFAIHSTPSDLQTEFRIGLNSVAYRFKTCFDSGETFAASVREHGGAPAQPHRYVQEREFFSCVVTGVTALDCLHYALFAWGAAVDPSAFPFGTQAQRRVVTPPRTLEAFRRVAGAQLLAEELHNLQSSPEYVNLQTFRNVLTHRGLPGRLISMTVGVSSPAPPPSRYQPFGELDGPEIDPTATTAIHVWLGSAITAIFRSANSTIRAQMAKPPVA